MDLRWARSGDRSEVRLTSGRVSLFGLCDRIRGWPGGSASSWRWSVQLIVDGGWHHLRSDSYRPTVEVAEQEAGAAIEEILRAMRVIAAAQGMP